MSPTTATNLEVGLREQKLGVGRGVEDLKGNEDCFLTELDSSGE